MSKKIIGGSKFYNENKQSYVVVTGQLLKTSCQDCPFWGAAINSDLKHRKGRAVQKSGERTFQVEEISQGGDDLHVFHG